MAFEIKNRFQQKVSEKTFDQISWFSLQFFTRSLQFFFSGAKPAKKSSQPLPRHWYTLELDVGCRYVKLIEDPQYSTEVIPMYDLAYLSPPPSAQVRRIPDIATKLNEPNLMQSETRIVAEGISQPNE